MDIFVHHCYSNRIISGDFACYEDIPTSILDREDEDTKPYIVQGQAPLFFSVFRWSVLVALSKIIIFIKLLLF